MEFKKFRFTSIIYILCIILLSIAGVYILFEKYFWLVSIWIFILDFFVVILFLRYIQKEHNKLAYFIVSISQNDFNLPHSKKYPDKEINDAFNQLSNVIKLLRDEAEINYQYLQMIVNQVGVVIICINDKNEIVLTNDAANLFFGKQKIRSIDSFSKIDTKLPSILKTLKLKQKKLFRLNNAGEIINYSIQVAEFKITNKRYKLFTINNVQNELEQKEIESWQKLTRVITHEIMNSVIPISNLSSLIFSELINSKGELTDTISDEKKADIKESLQTISSRSKALADFVQSTRNFTKMPKPELNNISVNSIIKRVLSLLKQKIKDSKIDVSFSSFPENIKILADKSLIEHALINILLNAIDAVENINEPKIVISVYINDLNQAIINVTDNGKGMNAEILENIFVPFFTTKRSGSGIGLSLSRQIMQLHKGNLIAKSVEGKGSSFTFIF